jgi:hypothetical protein
MNWLWVAAASAVVYLSLFVLCLSRRRWTLAGLGVAVANLFVAFLNSVAPIRGWADPDYLGFSFGFIRIEQGPGVTLVSGTIFVLAVASFCVALLDQRGAPMWVIVTTDGLLALNIGGALLYGLVTRSGGAKIQLGEYLTIGPLPSTLILIGLFVVPLGLASIWALRRTSVSMRPQGS